MAKESIYKYLTKMAAENPHLPYVFQNPFTAGARDVDFLLGENNLPFLLEEQLALELAELISVCVKTQEITKKTRIFLAKNPLYAYLMRLNKRLKLHLSEGILDREGLYSLGIKLATESRFVNEVKLGILLLGFFENDLVKQIIKTLGLHSEFTLYAVEAAKNFSNYNQFLFELVQNTLGYGKLAALTLFHPVKPEHKEWFFLAGPLNQVEPNIAAMICLDKIDMGSFYQTLTLTSENFSRLAALLAYAAENSNIKEFQFSLILVEKFLQNFPRYGKSFLDLACLVILERDMGVYREWHAVEENGWTGTREKYVRELAKKIMAQSRWKNVILRELAEPREETSLLLTVLSRFRLIPQFESFIPLLERDPFDLALLDFCLHKYPGVYLQDVYLYLSYVLPEDIFQKPLAAPEEIGSYYQPSLWLMTLIEVLQKMRTYEEELLLRCLTARYVGVRQAALRALRTFKIEWSKSVRPALQEAYLGEPAAALREDWRRLLRRKKGNREKKRRYVELQECEILPASFDTKLLTTEIAGTFFHDLQAVEVKTGDLLYLVPEPENKYDAHAVLVTTTAGYVLGYLPRTDNKKIVQLLASGERLYALFASEVLKPGKAKIEIMVNKRPLASGKIVQFPPSEG